MSFVTNTEIDRLVRFQILPPTEDRSDLYTLIFETRSGDDWACVADRQILQKLSAIIQKRTADPEHDE